MWICDRCAHDVCAVIHTPFGYLRITQFTDGVPEQVQEALWRNCRTKTSKAWCSICATTPVVW